VGVVDILPALRALRERVFTVLRKKTLSAALSASE